MPWYRFCEKRELTLIEYLKINHYIFWCFILALGMNGYNYCTEKKYFFLTYYMHFSFPLSYTEIKLKVLYYLPLQIHNWIVLTYQVFKLHVKRKVKMRKSQWILIHVQLHLGAEVQKNHWKCEIKNFISVQISHQTFQLLHGC